MSDGRARVGIGHWLEATTRLLALAGGVLLLLMITLSTASILGRAGPELVAWTGVRTAPHPIPGDAEIAQVLTAMALFTFLPWCQMRRGHLSADAFTSWLGPSTRRGLDIAWGVVFALAAGILAWRLLLGLLAKIANRDESMVLRIPDAWPMGVAVACTFLLCLAVLWTVYEDLTAEETKA